jgi:hypothetical protein
MVNEWEQAAIRHDVFRNEVLSAAQELIRSPEYAGLDGPAFALRGLELTVIDEFALNWWRKVWRRKPSPGNFDWDTIVAHFTRNDVDRFEVAIWLENRLLGLGIGRPSKGDDNLTLHFVERYWGHNPLRGWVAQIVTDAADDYATVLGKKRLKLKDVAPAAVATYEALGFALAERTKYATYYARNVEL